MAARTLRAVGRIFAYAVAGIPAAIGIGFVARFAFITSDTPTDGAATAFLFGMVAAGAFAGPAIAIAVRNNGHRRAACAWWALAVLAIAANWSHTLSAIAHRGAGLDAKDAKVVIDTATDRKTFARLEHDLGAMVFTPATANTVSAARSAAELAARNRKVECGDNNGKRGSRCRDRELEEQAKLDALTKAETNKAATDRAREIEGKAAKLRKQLADAPPVPATNALGRALGRFLSVSAMTAATVQQGFVSAIVELLIAAVLALPEMLRPGRGRSFAKPDASNSANDAQNVAEISRNSQGRERTAAPEQLQASAIDEAEILPPVAVVARVDTSRHVRTLPAIAKSPDVRQIADDEGIDPKPVVAFLAECVPAKRGSKADWGDIWSGFVVWQTNRGGETWSASQFGAVLRHICEQAEIRVRRQGDRVYCMDRRVTWK